MAHTPGKEGKNKGETGNEQARSGDRAVWVGQRSAPASGVVEQNPAVGVGAARRCAWSAAGAISPAYSPVRSGWASKVANRLAQMPESSSASLVACMRAPGGGGVGGVRPRLVAARPPGE